MSFKSAIRIQAYQHIIMTKEIISLDLKGLRCPEPVMQIRKQLRDMEIGEQLHIIADDPTTQHDIPRLCHFMGHQLIQQKSIENAFSYLIQKG